MRFILPILATTLMVACGDKDEDTAAESIDTADSDDTAAE